MANPHYSHTQTSPARFALFAAIVLSLLAGWIWRAEFSAWFSMVCVAGVSALVLVTMTTLTIRDEGEGLFVQFGPLPVFSTRIPFDEIKSARAGRSRIIDGWGIHYIPGRGWTWSLWGFDCVDIERERGPIRIGTDDASNLASYLQCPSGERAEFFGGG